MKLGLLACVVGATLVASAWGQDAKPDGAAPGRTMKAVRYHETGSPSVLVVEDAPRPVAGTGELLVRVFGAGVNPVDAKIRSGKFGRGGKFPMIPGFDVSGVVEEVGRGVTRFKAGDEVYAYLSLQHAGAYAEYAIVRESEAARKLAGMGLVQAAGVPLASLTAWQALVDYGGLADHPEKQQVVLIQGGSGGVGSFAVQIAKARGAKVYATASTKNIDFLRSIGADEPIDYTTQRFEDVAKDIDIVLDTVGGETQARSFDVMAKGGMLVSIVGLPNAAKAAEKGVRATGMLVMPNAAELEQIAALIEAGKIKPEVTEVLPLEDARKAHEQIETGHTRGKIVLRVAGEEK